MTPILDLDDWVLSLYADSTLLYSEPAVALETDGKLTFGRIAAAEARVHTRRINQGFFARLSADPLPQPFRSARNYADLFYHQLKTLVAAHPLLSREPVQMIVRGTTTPEQLGLALGVAKECGIRVGAFVDRSIAALASRGGMGERRCLEFATDHAEVCSARMGVDVVRTQVNSFPGLGIHNIQDGWANVIADAFIQHSRFDPLHAAATEQQLYDAIRSWFDRGVIPNALSIEHQQEVRRIEVRHDALEQKLLERLEPVLSSLEHGTTVCLGPNATTIPGLVDVLKRRGIQPVEVSRTDLLAYVQRHVSPLNNPDEVKFFTTLPAATPPSLAEFSASPPIPQHKAAQPTASQHPSPSRVVSKPGRATHGLHAAIAFPIGGVDLPWSAVGDDPHPGITLDVGGRLFTLIEVRS